MFHRRICHISHRNLRFIIIILLAISILFLLLFILTQATHSFSTSIIQQTIILIRTSNRCETRLNYLRQSWLSTNLAQQSNLYLITDQIAKHTDQTVLNSFSHIIETNCSETHNQFDLCCKTAHEFELYYNLTQINTNIHWMCRFDDDQYVNLKNLYQFLSQFNSSHSYYIGRTSIDDRLKADDHKRTYSFATYGAGVCFSHSLLRKFQPHVNKTILPANCIKRGISDDGYIGYLSEILLNISLTSFQELFHSHLEKLDMSFRSFTLDYLRTAITFGFAWDRYDLSWMPVIHQLIEFIHKNEEQSAKYLWTFLQNYEKEHPNRLEQKRDDS